MEAQVDFIANNDIANTLRLYTIGDQQDSLINYAIQQDGMNVIPSLFLDNPIGTNFDPNSSTADWSQIVANTKIVNELNNFVTALENLPTSDLAKVPFVVVGNEEISEVRGWSDTDIEDAIAYIKQSLPTSIASQLKFTTAETYDGQYMYLLNNANGINSVDPSFNINNSKHYIATNMGKTSNIDVIFVNINPYFDGVSVSNAATYVDEIYQTLQTLYQPKVKQLSSVRLAGRLLGCHTIMQRQTKTPHRIHSIPLPISRFTCKIFCRLRTSKTFRSVTLRLLTSRTRTLPARPRAKIVKTIWA